MLKKLAILVMAINWLTAQALAGADTTQDSAPQTSKKTARPASKKTTRPNSKSSSLKRLPASRKSSAALPTGARRRLRRTSRGAYRVSSYGEPTVDDNPSGEDPAVRLAAIEALGNWNGSVVVVDPNTGRIHSIVNQKLALSSGFTPCSTFKPIVALGALKEGIITAQTKLRTGGRLRMNLTDALAHSNNIFFLKLGQMMGFERLTEYAREFGFGERAGLDIVGESPGRFPSTPPKQGGVGYMAYYGQDIDVTPLQMAAAISAIANGGTLYYLQYPRTPEEIQQFEPKVRRRLEDLADQIPQVKDGLAGAVVYGTARLAYDPGLQIYGKTGTCSEDGARLGWFVSYSSDEPKYVVVVLLRGGRMVFGPHAAEIAGRVYHNLHQHEQAARLSQPGSLFPAAR